MSSEDDGIRNILLDRDNCTYGSVATRTEQDRFVMVGVGGFDATKESLPRSEGDIFSSYTLAQEPLQVCLVSEISGYTSFSDMKIGNATLDKLFAQVKNLLHWIGTVRLVETSLGSV